MLRRYLKGSYLSRNSSDPGLMTSISQLTTKVGIVVVCQKDVLRQVCQYFLLPFLMMTKSLSFCIHVCQWCTQALWGYTQDLLTVPNRNFSEVPSNQPLGRVIYQGHTFIGSLLLICLFFCMPNDSYMLWPTRTQNSEGNWHKNKIRSVACTEKI